MADEKLPHWSNNEIPQSKKLGSPKSLDEAIRHVLYSGPLSEVQKHARGILSQFIVQKFTVTLIALRTRGVSQDVISEIEVLLRKLIRLESESE